MRNTLLLTICILPVLQACDPTPENRAALPAPGTMRVLSVDLVDDPAADSLLPNGDFEEWYGGLPAPTGFHAPGPTSESTLVRDVKSGHLDTPGYTALQTWSGLGAAASPTDSFGASLMLEANTRYELEVVANTSPGFRAGIAAFEQDAQGTARMLKRCIVEISGEDPTRYTGIVETTTGGLTVLASHALGDSSLPGSVTWSSWQLRKTTDEAQALNIADKPLRRALVDNALAQVRQQVALYGGAQAWHDAMTPNREIVGRILKGDISKGESIPGYEGFAFEKEAVLWYRDTRDLARDENGGALPGFDALLRCERALNARGIDLIVIPVPDRVDICFDTLIPPDTPTPAFFAPHTLLLEALGAGDVLTVNVAPILHHLNATGFPVYWKTDPTTPSATLHAIADAAVPMTEAMAGDALAETAQAYTVTVDEIPRDEGLIPSLPQKYQHPTGKEVHAVQSVRDVSGALFTPAAEGPVLAVGSLAVLHQVRGASFAARLSMMLGRPVVLLRDTVPDTELPDFLAQGEAPELESARVVVFCFPERALSLVDWK